MPEKDWGSTTALAGGKKELNYQLMWVTEGRSEVAHTVMGGPNWGVASEEGCEKGLKEFLVGIDGSVWDTDLDLSFSAGLTANWLNDAVFIWPDFVIIYLQAAVVPAAHVSVVIVVFPHLFKVHDYVTTHTQLCTETHIHIQINKS